MHISIIHACTLHKQLHAFSSYARVFQSVLRLALELPSSNFGAPQGFFNFLKIYSQVSYMKIVAYFIRYFLAN